MHKNLSFYHNSNNETYIGIGFKKEEISDVIEVFLDTIYDAEDLMENVFSRQDGQFILTVITPQEYQSLHQFTNISNIMDLANPVSLNILGLGINEKQVKEKLIFAIVQSESIDHFRSNLGFSKKSLHFPLAAFKYELIDQLAWCPKNQLVWGLNNYQPKLKF